MKIPIFLPTTTGIGFGLFALAGAACRSRNTSLERASDRTSSLESFEKMRVARTGHPFFDVGTIDRLRISLQEKGLEEALSVVRSETLRADVAYLSDLHFEGRETPSSGLTSAASYVIERLMQHDWKEGASSGYRYPYSINVVSLDNTQTQLTFQMGEQSFVLRHGRDYYYNAIRGESLPLDMKTARILYGGDGRGTNFHRVDSMGKWLLLHESPHVSPQERRKIAGEAGARGLLIIPPPGDREDRHWEAEVRYRLALASRRGVALFEPSDGIDEIILSPQSAQIFQRRKFPHVGAELSGEQGEWRMNLQQLTEAPIQSLAAFNICGFFPGNDPELAKEIIVITAHLDHIGKLDFMDMEGMIMPGADDNASGSAVLLTLGEAIPKLKHPRSFLLIWTSGEELGLLGSKAWVKNPWYPDGHKLVANINVDMVGRNQGDTLLITPTESMPDYYNSIVRQFHNEASKEGIVHVGSADEVWSRSDHYPFATGLNLPVAFIFSGFHGDYHRPTDVAEKINHESLRRRTRLVLRVLHKLRGVIE